MPTLLLYDEQGLKLFEDITYLDEYYLTNAEIEVLEKHADEIAKYVQHGSQVVELGSGYDRPAFPSTFALMPMSPASQRLRPARIFYTDIAQQSSQSQYSVTGAGERRQGN